MHASVLGQLWVEGGNEHAALTQEYGLAVVLGQHLDLRTGLAHARRADEDSAQRDDLILQLEIGLEARDLASVRVPLDDDVHLLERTPAREQDHAGARSEDRPPELPDGFLQAVEPDQSSDGGRLAPRDDQPVEPFELLGLPYLDPVHAESPEHPQVLPEVSLDRQDADTKRLIHSRETVPPGPSPFIPGWGQTLLRKSHDVNIVDERSKSLSRAYAIASKVEQRPVRREEVRRRGKADDSRVAAPRPSLGSTAEPGSNWIECDVAIELEKVPVAFNQKSVIAPLEYVSGLAVAAIESLREVPVQPLHTGGEIDVGCPDDEVVVRRHETKCEARPIVAPYDGPKDA